MIAPSLSFVYDRVFLLSVLLFVVGCSLSFLVSSPSHFPFFVFLGVFLICVFSYFLTKFHRVTTSINDLFFSTILFHILPLSKQLGLSPHKFLSSIFSHIPSSPSWVFQLRFAYNLNNPLSEFSSLISSPKTTELLIPEYSNELNDLYDIIISLVSLIIFLFPLLLLLLSLISISQSSLFVMSFFLSSAISMLFARFSSTLPSLTQSTHNAMILSKLHKYLNEGYSFNRALSFLTRDLSLTSSLLLINLNSPPFSSVSSLKSFRSDLFSPLFIAASLMPQSVVTSLFSDLLPLGSTLDGYHARLSLTFRRATRKLHILSISSFISLSSSFAIFTLMSRLGFSGISSFSHLSFSFSLSLLYLFILLTLSIKRTFFPWFLPIFISFVPLSAIFLTHGSTVLSFV